MNEQIFPSWWGPKGGDPVQCRSVREVRPDWVLHHGHYDAARGVWVPRDPPGANADGAQGAAIAPSGDGIRALRAAYKARFGRKPVRTWDAAKLRARLARAG
jgi:hypothetical protein